MVRELPSTSFPLVLLCRKSPSVLTCWDCRNVTVVIFPDELVRWFPLTQLSQVEVQVPGSSQSLKKEQLGILFDTGLFFHKQYIL